MRGALNERLREHKSRRITRGSPTKSAAPAPSLGTGYGGRTSMHTAETTFERVSESPSMVLTLRYGVRAKLVEWGVPLPVSPSGSAFPASETPAVAAPPGWRG